MKNLKRIDGAIFAVPLPDGTYICGRVMLDIAYCIKRRLLPHDSPLLFFRDAPLIEMYTRVEQNPVYERSSVLIPGAFVEGHEIGRSWPIVGGEPVDATTVEFPESLIGFQHGTGDAAFRCGEIQITLPYNDASLRAFDAYAVRQSAFLWPFNCLWQLGRREEIPLEFKRLSLSYGDLRFSQFRSEVYQHLPFRMEQSYFEKQAQLGLHLERLYA